LHSLDELDRLTKEIQTERQTQVKQQIKQAQQNRSRIWIGLAIAIMGLIGYAIAVFSRILPSPIPLPPQIIKPK
jgi:hypothetical protein